jgi:hypothetical protein
MLADCGSSQCPKCLLPIDGGRAKLSCRVQGRRFGVRLPELGGSDAEWVSSYAYVL